MYRAFVLLSVAQQTCAQGDEGTEQTGLLQHSNRGHITLEHQSHEVASSSLARLYQSAKELLRTGATPKAQEFMKQMLEDLKPTIAHIDKDHAEDKAEIQRFDDELDAIEAKIAKFKDIMDEKAEKVDAKSAAHRKCRAEQAELCEATTICTEKVVHCENECELSKVECDVKCAAFKIEETAVPDKIEQIGNTTHYTWSGGRAAKKYIQHCEEHIITRKNCNSVNVACNSLKEDKKKKDQECSDLKQELEMESCSVKDYYYAERDALYKEWDSTKRLRDDFCNDLPALVKDRKAECFTLKRVECLLNKTSKDPCHTADEEIDKCKAEEDCPYELECGPRERPECAKPPIRFPCTDNVIDGKDYEAFEYAELKLDEQCYGTITCDCSSHAPQPIPETAPIELR